ncbi:reverse transcriptase [Elysia marginata]|uniref:Reverse transcriptase n=1 Tax=Elysia marginata TaxID=1093978 RepID=A0AAV4FIQ5_9GAST|nr:reverse transcriptase [Elysia marginata]
MHADSKEFTWARSNPFIARRLDYILCKNEMQPFVKNSEIIDIPTTDHKEVWIDIKEVTFKKGPGRWQFNASLVRELEFLYRMNSCIKDSLDGSTQENLNSRTKWELLKLAAKKECIEYGKIKNKKKNEILYRLQDELDTVTSQLSVDPYNQDLQENLLKLKEKIEVENLYKTQGAIVRYGIKWIEEGKKNSKFFIGLEKSRAEAKIP